MAINMDEARKKLTEDIRASVNKSLKTYNDSTGKDIRRVQARIALGNIDGFEIKFTAELKSFATANASG